MSHEVLRSTYTNHPTTGAPIRLELHHFPTAKRLRFALASRFDTFRSFASLEAATAAFEAAALAWS
jgi:hypothetical protein